MFVTIEHPKASTVFFNGKFFDTNKLIDVSFTEALRLGRLFKVVRDKGTNPYNPDQWKVNKSFCLANDVDSSSGWGNVAMNLTRSLSKKGYDPRLLGRTFGPVDPYVNSIMHKDIPTDVAAVWHDQPRDYWLDSPFGRNLVILPFETTQIPKTWVLKINLMDHMMVPCKQNIQMMRDSGVTIPIDLIHWGVDPKKFSLIERLDDGVFTFGHMGALSIRKGTDLVVKAFELAFPPTVKDVALRCKTSLHHYLFMSKDPRIKVDMTAVTHEELIKDFFTKSDIFVFPTRGEGFGLTPLEAMATGIPAIVTGWSGPVEYMNPDVGWILDYTMAPATEFSERVYKEYCGDWAEPSLDDLVAKMRYAYEHQDEVKAKGLAAAEYVKQNWLWDDKINMLIQVLDKAL